MLITSDELIERKIHLKTWLHELQVGGKAENAPSFPLSGPVTLPTRKRNARPRPGERGRQRCPQQRQKGQHKRPAAVTDDGVHC